MSIRYSNMYITYGNAYIHMCIDLSNAARLGYISKPTAEVVTSQPASQPS